jgi:hypothetical protein
MMYTDACDLDSELAMCDCRSLETTVIYGNGYALGNLCRTCGAIETVTEPFATLAEATAKLRALAALCAP